MKNMKVGELAKMTEMSIRTLHHYDEIGLLKPSQKTDSGHRVYAKADVERLQKIVSLRQLGLSLEEIKKTLDGKVPSLSAVIDQHISSLKNEIEEQRKVLQRLNVTANVLRSNNEVQIEELLETIKEVVMFEKFYSQDQLKELKDRAQQLGPEQIEAVQNQWPILIAKVRAKMDNGTDPLDPSVQVLAKRWAELTQMFTGGNHKIAQSTANMYKQEPQYAKQTGLDQALFEYVQKASAALKS